MEENSLKSNVFREATDPQNKLYKLPRVSKVYHLF
jgi:hypothetical protein